MPKNIDYNRGVIMRRKADQAGKDVGPEVFMYRDEPGVYRNAFGTEVDEELAKEAGFDTVRYGKMRLRGEKIKEVMAQIDQELGMEGAEAKVVAERQGFTVVDIGVGRHQVRDPDGADLSPIPLPKEQAMLLFDKLVPAKKPAKGKGRKEPETE